MAEIIIVKIYFIDIVKIEFQMIIFNKIDFFQIVKIDFFQTVVFCALEKCLEEQTGLYYKVGSHRIQMKTSANNLENIKIANNLTKWVHTEYK